MFLFINMATNTKYILEGYKLLNERLFKYIEIISNTNHRNFMELFEKPASRRLTAVYCQAAQKADSSLRVKCKPVSKL